MYLPTIPDNKVVEYQKIISYTDLNYPANTAALLMVGIPANYVVCGTSVRLLTQFGGAGISSVTCSLGAFVPNSVLSDIIYYGLELELTQTVTPTTFSLSGPTTNDLSLVGTANYFPSTAALYFNAAHDIAAYFTAQGNTLANLSAGVVEVIIQIRSF